MKEPYKSCTECTFGYCAPLRCYCGHEECTSFASYIDRSQIKAEPIVSTTQHAQSWNNREEATWLDKL